MSTHSSSVVQPVFWSLYWLSFHSSAQAWYPWIMAVMFITSNYCLCSLIFEFSKPFPLCSMSTLQLRSRYDSTFCTATHPTHTHTHTHTEQVGICRHSAGNAHIYKHSGTILVILARHWLRLPMTVPAWSETCQSNFYNFNVFCVFNNPIIHIIECISLIIIYLLLLMHGVTMKLKKMKKLKKNGQI